jgi:hypothetical protein
LDGLYDSAILDFADLAVRTSKPLCRMPRGIGRVALCACDLVGANLWLLVGTDSAFEGVTEPYDQRIVVQLTPE